LTATIGAAPGERTTDRLAQRNGHRPKLLTTPAGDVELAIPKLRQGSFFPELSEPRRRIDKALWAVIMTAYVTGTSTRKVDDLVKALGCDSGVSKSTVSRICTQIDADVHVLRTRRLDHQPFVYVWLDATYIDVRENRHVVSKAVVIATGLRADGYREVLGVDIGDSETEVFWTEFLGSLRDRGLAGVKLVISDAHAGLVAAIRTKFQGATWQRCRVHAMRNMMGAAPHQTASGDLRIDPHDLRSTRPHHRVCSVAPRCRSAATARSESRRVARGHGSRPTRLHLRNVLEPAFGAVKSTA